MKLLVAHFCRQFLNPTETFIRNQIESHIDFSPIIIFKEYIPNNPYTKILLEKYPTLNLSSDSNRVKNLRYKYFRLNNKKDTDRIIKYIIDKKVDILHFHFGTDAGFFLKYLRFINIPKVVSFYGYDCSSFPRKYFSLGKLYLKQRTFRYADVILAMSQDMKEDLIKIGCPKEKIIIHYFGSKLEKFSFFDRDISDKKDFTLLILATLTPKKGHRDLLYALNNLIKKGICNFKLRIVGSGPLEVELKRLVKNLSIDSYIHFVGSVPYLSDQMLEEIKNADIFIHPSVTDDMGNKEGIPTIIIEAMASGLPVVSTYHAGIPSVISHNKTGLLVNEHDIDNLANEILKLMNNNTLRKEIGQNAQEFALKNLNLNEKEKELEDIYKQLIKNRSKNINY